MSYASKLKQKKEIKIVELEENFNNIKTCFEKLENVVLISISKDPYILLITYQEEQIQLTYNIYTCQSNLQFKDCYVKIINIPYQCFEEKGITYYLKLLSQLKIETVDVDFNKVQNILPNNAVITNYPMDVALGTPNTFRVKYKNSYNFIFSLDPVTLQWRIEFYLCMFIQNNIDTESLINKGISYHLDKLVNAYYEYEYPG